MGGITVLLEREDHLLNVLHGGGRSIPGLSTAALLSGTFYAFPYLNLLFSPEFTFLPSAVQGKAAIMETVPVGCPGVFGKAEA